jgi:hypothetical protein
MLKVTKLEVRSLDLDHLDVFWVIGNVPGPRRDEDPHEILSYQFFILRAGDSPMGPYEQIAGPFVDQYSFRDSQVTLLHKWRQYHYKLRVVDRRTGESEEFGPASSGAAPPDLIQREIMRQEDILFREFTGRRCWLFPVRTFGPRCSCFDMTTGRVTRSNHALCYGTGFLGGFMSPIEVFVQIDPNNVNTASSSLQEVQQSDTSARLISFPPVNPQDILVEAENRRWRVINMMPTERLRAMVRQELRIHEVPRGDIIYDLPLRVDLSVSSSARRNFTNPQNLENDGDISPILAAYGGFPPGTL